MFMSNDKQYKLPLPIIDKKELELLDLLTERYDIMIQPNKVIKLGKKIGTLIPSQAKGFGQELAANVSAQELYQQALESIATGFKVIEEQATKYTISEQKIIQKINMLSQINEINAIDEICLMRSYDISKVVNSSKGWERIAAIIEGGVTGAVGFWGLPFNLALSTLLYFRAVQSIAIHYGFDVKKDAAELIIASEVFISALSPAQNDLTNELNGIISKIMVMTQASVVKQTAAKTWTDMASRGGVPLLITQMRALANKAAQKALENAGEKGLEHSVFKEVFEQIGRKLTLKRVQKAVPVISAVLGALIDIAQMDKVLEYADIFYQKRFIMEKKARVFNLVNLDSNSKIVEFVQE